MKPPLPVTRLFFVAIISLTLISCIDTQISLKPIRLELKESENLSPKANLGKVLFYDKQLSFNNSIACASCHKQNLAFTDNVPFSTGYENILTTRNSMPIQNLGQSSSFGSTTNSVLFWDGRESFLPSMVVQPIKNHIEMGFDDLDELSTKLSGLPYYDDLFQRAYGHTTITPDKIASALSRFVLSINSKNTKLDAYIKGNTTLTGLELQGQELFVDKYGCNKCHLVEDPLGYISAGTFANIGLDKEYTDSGLMNVSTQEDDKGRFKIPSLRNVVLTGPYMHDGRFETLEEVIDHYSGGLKNNDNLDFRLKNTDGSPMRLEISTSEKTAIIAFLNTLTDYQMISDPKLSDPFK